MDGDLRLLTIVGIVGDTHEYGLDVPPRPTVYVNLFQRPRPWITVTMLSDADTRSVTSAARGILHVHGSGDGGNLRVSLARERRLHDAHDVGAANRDRFRRAVAAEHGTAGHLRFDDRGQYSDDHERVVDEQSDELHVSMAALQHERQLLSERRCEQLQLRARLE